MLILNNDDSNIFQMSLETKDCKGLKIMPIKTPVWNIAQVITGDRIMIGSGWVDVHHFVRNMNE